MPKKWNRPFISPSTHPKVAEAKEEANMVDYGEVTIDKLGMTI
tara:strand:+ start:23 stop:151 length:129 start_codon:yes stop_codon:yes gene_type:complete